MLAIQSKKQIMTQNYQILNQSKSFTLAAYDKFTSQTLDAKTNQKGLLDKSAIAEFINNADLDKKVVTANVLMF